MTGLRLAGFVLHMAMMHLWLAGTCVALGMQSFGGVHAQRLSARLLRALPIVVALGVNFGIVPLLFLQVTHGLVFYPATILMAWPWLGVIGLLLFAYYGLYVCALGLREGRTRLSRPRLAAGWVSAVFFLAIAFLFASAMTLFEHPGAWAEHARGQQVAGAVLGVALHLEPAVLARWLMMLGLALTTTAVALAFDAAVLTAHEGEAYRRWVSRASFGIASAGLGLFALAGSVYAFATWPEAARARMLQGGLGLLTGATALAPGLPWLLLLAHRRAPSRRLALAALAAQGLVLALNAGSRLALQTLVLAPHFDPTTQPVATQWSPILAFLGLLGVGLGVIGWMLARAVSERRAAGMRGPAARR